MLEFIDSNGSFRGGCRSAKRPKIGEVGDRNLDLPQSARCKADALPLSYILKFVSILMTDWWNVVMLTPKSMTSIQKHILYTQQEISEPSQQAILRTRSEETCPLAVFPYRTMALSLSTHLVSMNEVLESLASSSRGSPLCRTSMCRSPRMLEGVVPSTSCGAHVQENDIRTRIPWPDVTQYCLWWSSSSAARAQCVSKLLVVNSPPGIPVQRLDSPLPLRPTTYLLRTQQ
jgi:hypothetical protein